MKLLSVLLIGLYSVVAYGKKVHEVDNMQRLLQVDPKKCDQDEFKKCADEQAEAAQDLLNAENDEEFCDAVDKLVKGSIKCQLDACDAKCEDLGIDNLPETFDAEGKCDFGKDLCAEIDAAPLSAASTLAAAATLFAALKLV